MPGLTDAHWHMTVAANTMENLEQADPGLMHAHTVAEAQRTIMRGEFADAVDRVSAMRVSASRNQANGFDDIELHGSLRRV